MTLIDPWLKEKCCSLAAKHASSGSGVQELAAEIWSLAEDESHKAMLLEREACALELWETVKPVHKRDLSIIDRCVMAIRARGVK